MRAAGRLAPLLGLLVGCSSLAPEPPEVECVVDADCNDDSQVCGAGVCRDGSGVPPITYIGLDLQEVAGGQAQFRAEIAGCDEEVADLDETSIEVLSLPRRQLTQTISLASLSAPAPDEAPPPLPATFTITQGSRFARDGLRRQITFDPAQDVEQAFATIVWPRYHVDNDLPSYLGEGGYLVWQTQPLAEVDASAKALRYQLLSPPVLPTDPVSCTSDIDCCPPGEECGADDVRNACITTLGACGRPFEENLTYDYIYVDDCDRQIRGQVVSVGPDLTVLGPSPGASITLRHADAPRTDPLGQPRLDPVPVADRESECDADADCPQGLICNVDTQQCELPLAGLAAWTGTLAEGQVDARVYTYCEGLPVGEPLQRTFELTVTPPEQLGAPTVTLRAAVSFDPIQGGQKPVASFGGDLCVPLLGPLEDVTLALSGEPRTLLEGYACCDIDCLPRTAEDAATGRPEARTQCAGATSGATASFRVESSLALDDDALEAWNAEDSSCVPIVADARNTVGVLRRTGACGSLDMAGTVQPQCDLRLPSGDAGDPRIYSLRIETPTGSVSGSRDLELEVGTTAGSTLETIALPDRILLRGRVTIGGCDREDQPDGDCGSLGAQVLAERLRMDGESVANTPGPYFHRVATFHDPTAEAGSRDGAYILPLDEGVWVITALPDSGTDGGPARISILDLRGVDDEVARDFLLEPGILVTFDVSSFDRRSQIIPLDTGSWRLDTPSQLRHPDRVGQPDEVLDLGAPGECLSTDATMGCRIRRLVGGSSLPPSQLGQVRFTTRDLDVRAVDCRR